MTKLRGGCRTAIGVGLAALLACQGGNGQSSESTPAMHIPADGKETPAAGATAGTAPGAGECPSWADLDLGSLPTLPSTPYTATLDQVWRMVLQKHYDPTLGCLDWPSIRTTYGAKLEQAADAKEAYDIMNAMLGELAQSHFGVIPPAGRVVSDEPVGPGKIPLDVRWIGDEVVVVRSGASGHLGRVEPGAKLLEISDLPVSRMVEKIKRVHPRESEAAFHISRAVAAKLSCRRGQSRKVRVTDPKQDDKQVIRMLKCAMPKGELVTLGNLKNVPTRVEYRLIEGTEVGYLSFNIWMLPMVKRVHAAVEDLRGLGMTALILDLRGNPGGVGPMSVSVARVLLAEEASLGRLRFREFTQEFNVKVEDNPFTGPVTVLVDEGTASTSEIFTAGMRDLGRIKVFGSRASAGAALPSVIEELEGGALLQYVVGDYESPKGAVVEGNGIEPDTVVPETRADFAAGRDPVLEAAVAALAQE